MALTEDPADRLPARLARARRQPRPEQRALLQRCARLGGDAESDRLRRGELRHRGPPRARDARQLRHARRASCASPRASSSMLDRDRHRRLARACRRRDRHAGLRLLHRRDRGPDRAAARGLRRALRPQLRGQGQSEPGAARLARAIASRRSTSPRSASSASQPRPAGTRRVPASPARESATSSSARRSPPASASSSSSRRARRRPPTAIAAGARPRAGRAGPDRARRACRRASATRWPVDRAPSASTSRTSSATCRAILALRHLRVVGLHIYSGTQCLKPEALVRELPDLHRHLLEISATATSLRPRRLVFGSGLGIRYHDDDAAARPRGGGRRNSPRPRRALRPAGDSAAAQLVLELGRYLVGEAGYFLTRVVVGQGVARRPHRDLRRRHEQPPAGVGPLRHGHPSQLSDAQGRRRRARPRRSTSSGRSARRSTAWRPARCCPASRRAISSPSTAAAPTA